MKENHEKRTAILTTIVCLIPVLVGAALYSRLPDEIATHWDGNGVPNGWQPKFVGAIIFPGILVAVNLLMPVLLRIDPKYKNMDGKLKTLVQWIIPLVAMFCSGTTLATALGKDIPIVTTGTMLMGVLFIAIGNYLPKTKQSYTLGIKLPWTLDSEENWNRTHRLAGILWVICGMLIVIAGIFGQGRIVLPLALILMIAVPSIYSYLLYRNGVR